MSKKDGGQAFPFAGSQQMIGGIRTTYQPEAGMTLRDYFAAAALNGILSRGTTAPTDELAQNCFRIADAMVSERVK